MSNLTRLYQNSTYSTLETPTKSHILRAINNLNSLNIKPEDYILFFFAGHGVYQEGHYLLPMDFIEGELKETAISVENLVTRFRDTGSHNIIMILDACRSVHHGRGFPKKTIWQPISPQDYKRPGVLIFQSCDHDQVSFEIIDLRHGVFTKALLDVWEPKNPNLSFRVLNEKVAARMSELCRENGLDNQRCCLRAEPIEKTDLVIPMWSGIPDTTQPHSFRINYPTDGMSSKQVHKCSGGYNGKWNEGEVWAILRDKYNRCYLQNPPVHFYPDGRWFQNNISCGTDIEALEIVEVGLMGQSIFRDLVNKNFWGAFAPPSDMNILDTISLEPY